MQRLTVGASTVLLDDETARAIVWYARLLGDARRVECIELSAFDVDERGVTVQMLLGAGIPVMAMTARASVAEPDNADVRDRILADTRDIEDPPLVPPMTEPWALHDIEPI